MISYKMTIMVIIIHQYRLSSSRCKIRTIFFRMVKNPEMKIIYEWLQSRMVQTFFSTLEIVTLQSGLED